MVGFDEISFWNGPFFMDNLFIFVDGGPNSAPNFADPKSINKNPFNIFWANYKDLSRGHPNCLFLASHLVVFPLDLVFTKSWTFRRGPKSCL